MTFYDLLKASRKMEMSDGNITLTWIQARELAEHGERLEIEISRLKSELLDWETAAALRKGLKEIKPSLASESKR